MGVLLVEGLALLVECAQRLAWGHNDAAGVQIRDPVLNGFVVEVEVYD
jgi:hypothetical protein